MIAIPIMGAALAWPLGHRSAIGCRCLALAAMTAELALSVYLLTIRENGGQWIAQFDSAWIPQLGVRIQLGIDGLSLWLILLTSFIGIIAIAASWTGIATRVGLFHCQLLLALAGITGVFLALDLFLFYLFWELMLVPTYFIISIWGDQNRGHAATRFLIFTQAGGLLMLVSILALHLIHGRATGDYTFAYTELLGTKTPESTGLWLALGFSSAFLVKMPIVPFHTWLPAAYTSAPTGGSILLAALLSKTGAYGLMRFVKPLFPNAVEQLAPVMMVLGVAGILYGATMAFGQRDLKRLIGYSSISHLGFVLLGIFAGTTVSMEGSIMQMLAHGISVAGLFLLAGSIEERLATRELDRMSGIWTVAPRMSAAGMIFALATLGLPGLGNFIGEFLVLAGSLSISPVLTAVATSGFVFSVIYALSMVQAVFQGPWHSSVRFVDLKIREVLAVGALVLSLLWLGIHPNLVFDTIPDVGHPRPTAVANGVASPHLLITP